MPPAIKEKLTTQHRVGTFSKEMWQTLGPNMAKKGANLSHVSRRWLRELILTVKRLARFFMPDLMTTLNKMKEDEASLASWLDQLR